MIGDDTKPRDDADQAMEKDDRDRVLRRGRSAAINRAVTEQQQRSDFSLPIDLGTNEPIEKSR